MIIVLSDSTQTRAAQLVHAALVRSFTSTQVRFASPDEDLCACQFLVAIDPAGNIAETAHTVAEQGGKVVLLGHLDAASMELAGVRLVPLPAAASQWAECPPAPTHGHAASRGHIRYSQHALTAAVPLRERALLRFDFTNEWNNLGYGRIGASGAIWDLAQAGCATEARTLAELTVDGTPVGLYASARDLPEGGSVVWFNRPVGPLDSHEWTLVENFFSDYRTEELPTLPRLCEIPDGLGALVTMRLDCDEEIAAARPLFEFYRARNTPFSLAVKTSLPEEERHLTLLREVLAAGGAILSHSVNHPVNWGGDPDTIFTEAAESKQTLERWLPGTTIRHTASPFHQTPVIAPAQLVRAGYQGFVGGVISAEPDYVLARSGIIPEVSYPFVSASQQCMLHGDCMLPEGDPLAIYKQSFDFALAARAPFAFFDHPFSPRYAYGWPSEEGRIDAHRHMLDYITGQAAPLGGVRFVNENDYLDLVRERMGCQLSRTEEGFSLTTSTSSATRWTVHWRGQNHPVSAETAHA